MAKTALIIQCDIVAKKCVGYACMKSFETRTGKFAGLEEGVNYLSTTCGGCCGMGVAAKLEDLNRKLKRWGDSKDDVTVYLIFPKLHRKNVKPVFINRLNNFKDRFKRSFSFLQAGF